MRQLDMRLRFGIAGALLGLLLVTSSDVEAQSPARDICYPFASDFDEVQVASSLVPGTLPSWCERWIEHGIGLLIPVIYGLDESDVHPSEISEGLDDDLPYTTAVQYNDLVDFSDADSFYSPRYRWQQDCFGTTCYLTNPTTGEMTSRDFTDGGFSGRGIQWTVLGEWNGLTLLKRESRTYGRYGTAYDWTGFGAWASESTFFSRWKAGVNGYYAGSGEVWSYSAGRASYGNPVAITAHWSGFMTGIDIGFASTRGNPILGNADVSFDNRWGQATVDVTFWDVLDVKTLEQHSDMWWYDLPVYNGVFGSGADSDSISGQFYGSYHQEVGGIFERNGISGAFGATRE